MRIRRLALPALLVAFTAGAASASAQVLPVPPVDSIAKDFDVSIDKKRGKNYFWYGGGFLASPFPAEYQIRRLTVWLPKGLNLVGKGCKKSNAKKISLDSMHACKYMAGGQDPTSTDVTAWFAYYGPKTSKGQQVWTNVRIRDELERFGTGFIKKPSGAYGQKLTIEFRQLSMKTRAVQLAIEKLVRSGGAKCPSGGWKWRARMQAKEGTVDRKGKSDC